MRPPYRVVVDPAGGRRRPVLTLAMTDDEHAVTYRDAVGALEDVIAEIHRRRGAMLRLRTSTWRLLPEARPWRVVLGRVSK